MSTSDVWHMLSNTPEILHNCFPPVVFWNAIFLDLSIMPEFNPLYHKENNNKPEINKNHSSCLQLSLCPPYSFPTVR